MNQLQPDILVQVSTGGEDAVPDAAAFPYHDEEWFEVYGNARYLISTYGRVYHVAKRRLANIYVDGRPSRHRVALWAGGVRRTASVAQEVLIAFGDGPRPGNVAIFVDGDPSNCRLGNLAWAALNSPEHRHAREAEAARASAAEPMTRPEPVHVDTPARTRTTGPEERATIRAWAARKGLSCAPRGAIPVAVLQAFDEEHAPRTAGAA